MNLIPSFSSQGYLVKQELGHNRAGGRITYLATTHSPDPLCQGGEPRTKSVVIKQFQFAQSNSNWSDYEGYQQEIQLLQQLNHPSIPLYIDSFQTSNGFCLVQEYKNAPSLAQPYPWTPEEIKQIAIALLQVLVYLQQQKPPIIHRDIKPENILVDRQQRELKVYLVDFGFARTGCGDVAVSSAVKGTLGFMPPEQIFNRELTKASDLYSLGVTLICLLTQTASTKIGHLTDDRCRMNFKHLLPSLHPKFINWLEKMVAPNPKQRFKDAATALKVLHTISATKHPIAPSNHSALVSQRQPRKLAIGLGLYAFFSSWAVLSSISLTSSLQQENYSLRTALYSVKQHSHQNFSSSPTAVLLNTRQCPQCSLTNISIKNANLAKANLGKANLSSAKFVNVNLDQADLRGTQLDQAEFINSKLRSANLGYAFLWQANLKKSDMSFANLWGADLRNSQLENAELKGAILEGAKLGNANLLAASLEEANLTEASLEEADLRGANLSHADLSGAYLRGANLRGANLRGANLRSANLRDANLKGAIMPDGAIHP